MCLIAQQIVQMYEIMDNMKGLFVDYYIKCATFVSCKQN